jgi:hypothetical protein
MVQGSALTNTTSVRSESSVYSSKHLVSEDSMAPTSCLKGGEQKE